MSLHDAFNELRQAIRNINCYQSAYINPEVGTITDEFGSVEILPNTATSWGNGKYPSRNCFLIHPKSENAYIDCLPPNANYVNLRNNQMNNTVRITSNIIQTVTIGTSNGNACVGYCKPPETLILPKTFYGDLNIILYYSGFTRGLYLNSYGRNVVRSEGWAMHVTTSSAENKVIQSTVDFDSGYNMSPMYLNRLYLSTKTFENLANKLGTVTGGKLYLGTKNTDRMTTAQKDAITAKGWTIY